MCTKLSYEKDMKEMNRKAVSDSFKWLVSLLFKHRHRWQTTATDMYLLPCAGRCKCGATRTKSNKPFPYGSWIVNEN